MKMGTIASPWRYDAVLSASVRLAKARRTDRRFYDNRDSRHFQCRNICPLTGRRNPARR
jgi:hypothetical protein